MDCKECKNYQTNLDPIAKLPEMCLHYKPKDETIYVPEGIEFTERQGVYGMGLRFGNNQELYYFYRSSLSSDGLWKVDESSKQLKVKTKLTPIDRKDLKAGDWAYLSGYKVTVGDCKSQYHLIVNSGESKWIDREDIKTSNISDNSVNWWKVEKA